MAVEPLPRDPVTVERIIDLGSGRLRARMVAMEGRLLETLAELSPPLCNYASTMVLAGGKRIRPLLVFLAAEQAVEPLGAEREEGLLRAAVAVELIHSATLIHDDLIDGATLRRGRPTVAAAAGERAAIATGDAVFSRAFSELAKNGDPEQLRTLSNASSALVAGEFLQREDAYAVWISEERYLTRCELKTAALFEAAARLGALAVEAGSGMARALGRFARRIGIAFQLLDDVLDIAGRLGETGKARGRDLLEGTVTLPLILARQLDPALATLDLRGLRDGEKVEEVCRRIAATGALEEVRSRALAEVRAAKAELPSQLAGPLRELLCLVADGVVARCS